jgi:hypothetical protein
MTRDHWTLCSKVMGKLWTRKREMRRDGENYYQKVGHQRILCKSIYHAWPGKFKSQSGRQSHRDDIFKLQSGMSYFRLLISTHIMHIIIIFIPHVSFSHPQLDNHCRMLSSIRPLYLTIPWLGVNTVFRSWTSAASSKCWALWVQHTWSTAQFPCALLWAQ